MDANSRQIAGARPQAAASGSRSGSRSTGAGRLMLLAFLAGLCGGGACNNSPSLFTRSESRPRKLAARTVPYLTGVPVPLGFEISERLTDAYESGAVRFARQEYVGFAQPQEVRQFYRDQMPQFGWREISNQDVKGRTLLRFESANEECTIEIETSAWFNRTSIQVIVKPFNRAASEPPARRPMP